MKAAINEFVDPETGRIDINDWRHDICARMITDHVSPENEGISTNELCMIYFGYVDLDRQLLINMQMQEVRKMLQERAQPIILRSHRRRWYVVGPEDTGGARGFLVDRAKRWLRGGRRLETTSGICQETYSLPQGDPLVGAIEGSKGTLDQVDQALQLPSGDGNKDT